MGHEHTSHLVTSQGGSPQQIIKRMKEHLRIETDDELAAYFTRMRKKYGSVSRRATHLSPSAIRNWRLPGRGVPPDVILDFSDWEGVSTEWLRTGEGPKFRKDAIKQAEESGHTFDLRTIRVMLEAQQSPELVRAIEAAIHDHRLRKIVERLPKLSPSQIDVMEKVAEL